MDLKVLIVEDEVMIAEMLREMLVAEGVLMVESATSYSEALKLLANQSFDLAVLDVNIGAGKSGIDLGEVIRAKYKMSIVYATSFSDSSSLASIASLKPDMYISKPYRLSDIRAALQIVKSNRVEHGNIEIKKGGEILKIPVNAIRYVKTDNIYLTIFTETKRYIVRSTLESFLEEFRMCNLLKVHRSYAVAIDKVDRLMDGFLIIGADEIPVSKANRKEIAELFKV